MTRITLMTLTLMTHITEAEQEIQVTGAVQR